MALKDLFKLGKSTKEEEVKKFDIPTAAEIKEFVEKLAKDSKVLIEVLTPFASLLYSIYKWAKESKVDGEITEEEFKEVLGLVKEFVENELKKESK